MFHILMTVCDKFDDGGDDDDDDDDDGCVLRLQQSKESPVCKSYNTGGILPVVCYFVLIFALHIVFL